MTMTKAKAAALASVVALLAAVPAALADSPANTPAPVAGTPSCNGVLVATINHNSGDAGASGNPNASGGPGEFLGPDTHAAIQDVRQFFCTR
jgi:uncharacterized membrane protein